MVEKKEQDMRSTQRRENISTDWNHQEYGFATSHSDKLLSTNFTSQACSITVHATPITQLARRSS